jgi:hypothetical protein
LSKCKLDVSHPKFCVLSSAPKAAFDAGIEELQTKLANGHQLSHFVPQPMPGYPQYENKVWKWDFQPAGNKSYTRKGWRLYAYVADPDGPEPILAQAFLAYDKSDQPAGNPAKYVADALKAFLIPLVAVRATPDRFRRQTLADGKIVSLCYECCETLFSANDEEADGVEASHQCAPLPY